MYPRYSLHKNAEKWSKYNFFQLPSYSTSSSIIIRKKLCCSLRDRKRSISAKINLPFTPTPIVTLVIIIIYYICCSPLYRQGILFYFRIPYSALISDNVSILLYIMRLQSRVAPLAYDAPSSPLSSYRTTLSGSSRRYRILLSLL